MQLLLVYGVAGMPDASKGVSALSRMARHCAHDGPWTRTYGAPRVLRMKFRELGDGDHMPKLRRVRRFTHGRLRLRKR